MRNRSTILLCVAALALGGCGTPVVPGQRAQACVNKLVGSDAPPPVYTQVKASAIKAPYDARFAMGEVWRSLRGTGAKLAAHEALRQAKWWERDGRPSQDEFSYVERRCGGRGRG